MRFVLHGPGESMEMRSPLLGRMNVRNLVGIAALARRLGVPADAVSTASASFRGVRRRQQVVRDDEVVLIDDFAHHPTAITLTLAAVRDRYPERRVWAVFDPRSNTTRRRIFQDRIAESLAAADRVVLGPVHRADELPIEERFSPQEACERIEREGRQASFAADYDQVVARVEEGAKPGDVVVVLSNGAFGGIVDRLNAGL